MIGQLFSLFSRSSTPEEREAAAGMAADYAQQYGPGVFDSLSSWISGIGQSRTALQRRLFKLQAQYATADESKRAELDWKIRALQAQINEYDMQVGSMSTEIAPPETPTISPWILGAVAFVALSGTLYLTSKSDATHYGYYAGKIENDCANAAKQVSKYDSKLKDACAKLEDKSLRRGPIKKSDRELENEIARHQANLVKWQEKYRILKCETAVAESATIPFDPFQGGIPTSLPEFELPALPASTTPTWLLPVLGIGVLGLFGFAPSAERKEEAMISKPSRPFSVYGFFPGFDPGMLANIGQQASASAGRPRQGRGWTSLALASTQ